MKANDSSIDEDFPLHFSEWLKRRRLALDLTQNQLAKRASCSVYTIRKMEGGERWPSRQLAGLLAQALDLPAEDQTTFIRVARGELILERLPAPAWTQARDYQPAAKPQSISGNLPRMLTPFIGREPELSALGQLLQDPQCSLITIVGPGGIGKTRLAIEAARHYQDHFSDGVWFVPLAALNSPAVIVPTIAEAMNFRLSDPANPKVQLLRFLGEKRALLIVDNAEHLLEGVGLFTEILNACPQVKLLVTSRERLNLLSEWLFEIGGLPVPADDRGEQFETFSSVALFLQCARRVRAGFELLEADQRWVLKICQIMEGMPLGIELSAAWVGLLPCEAIAKEIEHNIDFLTVSMHDLPERHRSLRATLDHSWKLLNPEEQRILSRLSVFHGSFRREAAMEICGASLAVLSSFRNKMLMYRAEEDLFYLHELVRQYAELKLKEDPDEDARIKDRHSTYFVQSLAEWEKALKSSRQVETLNEIAQVLDDLSQAWQWMVTRLQPHTLTCEQFSIDGFTRSLFSLSLFYEMRNRSLEAIPIFKESVDYLKSMRSAFKEKEDCSVFFSVLGHVTAFLGVHHVDILQSKQARAYLEEAVELLEKGQSRVLQAQAQVMLASFYLTEGQLQKAAGLLEQSREVFREEGDEWWYLLASIRLSTPYISLRKLQECDALLQEASEAIEPGDYRLGFPLRANLAYLLNLQKNFSRAEELLQENLRLSYQFGTYYQTADILYELGRLALATHRIELAEKFIRQAIDTLSESGQIFDASRQEMYLGLCLAARGDRYAARNQFRKAIKEGEINDRSYLVYWGLVNIARTYLEDGQTEKALEIVLALRHSPVEFIKIKEDGERLLADLQAQLPQRQIEVVMQKVDSQFIPDPAGANALAYALKLVTE